MPNKKEANTVKVGLVQMACAPAPAVNMKKALARINEAAKKGAQIICLQELFRSQYFCQTEDIELFKFAETIPGPTTETLSQVARQKKVVVIASLFEKRAAGVYHNTAVMIDADGNRVGHEGKLKFWGQSFVADPFGRIIAKASPDKEEVLVVPCDLDKIEETRQNWPFLRDRRIDAYDSLSCRFIEPASNK